jgi:ubiquitin-conjugating enzyme E2 D/E
MSGLSPAAESTLKRLAAELLNLLRHPSEGFSAHPTDGNLFRWNGTVQGPRDTPYARGLFKLNINIPGDYPVQPPTVTFATKIYHPNIDSDSGFISLSILGDEWSPVLTISTVLLSIQAYFGSPDTTNAVMPEIAHEYESDRAKYEETAKQWTDKYADRTEVIEPTPVKELVEVESG